MAQKRWQSVICRLRGHAWEIAEVPGYHPDGRVFVRGRRRFCTRCSARSGASR